MQFTILLISVCVLAAFGLLFRSLGRRLGAGPFDPLDWLEQFSAVSYRPMERLLDNRDYTFLASQPGFQPSIARRLRRQRVGIFQSYLGAMIRDFHRLLQAARSISVYASQDQSGFEAALWRLRFRFYGAVLAIETGVALNALGWGNVDARGLVGILERTLDYTRQLTPSFEAA